MNKSLLILFITISSLVFTSSYTIASTNQISSNNDTALIAKITKLSVSIQSSSKIFYDAEIQTYNPNNAKVTFNLDNWCGFSVSVDARINAKYNGTYGDSICNLPFGTFPKTYQPGYTYENYNATTNFAFQNNSLSDLPMGFYYFDILIDIFPTPAVSKLSALFLYYGNGNSQTQYNVNTSYPNRPQYDSPLIPQELSSYSQSLQVSSTQSANFNLLSNFENLLFLILTIIVIIFGIIYIRSKKLVLKKEEYDSKDFEKEGYVSKNFKQFETDSNYNKIPLTSSYPTVKTKNLHYCHLCQSQVNEKDVFCNNCGSRLQ